jgi:simple sugar transport system substrate-binding protein
MMVMRVILTRFCGLLILGFGLMGVAFGDTLQVGFVYVGPIGDHGWTYQHNKGREYLEKMLGSKVETTYVESVAEGGDSERVIEQLASSGHDVIFTTSFGYMNPTLKVAKRYPHVKFEHATGFKRVKNVSTYNARYYEGRHVLGLIAGHVSKSGVMGYVASFPIPEVVRGINATILAARKINPDMRVKVVWVNSWFDPGKESDAAKALIDQGADVILQHTDSPAPVQTAESRGVYAFGQASDMSSFGADAHLTAIENVWGPYYVSRVKAVMDGSWKSSDTWGGLEAGMVKMAPYGPGVPSSVRKVADKAVADIKAGRLHPFTGPIKSRDGEMKVPVGSVADDGLLLGMDFFVEGVEGSLPGS